MLVVPVFSVPGTLQTMCVCWYQRFEWSAPWRLRVYVWAGRNTHSKHKCVLLMPIWMHNALRYSENTLRLTVVPFGCYHLMLQHDYVQPMLQASVYISWKPKLLWLWHVWHRLCDKMAFKLLWSARSTQLLILIHQLCSVISILICLTSHVNWFQPHIKSLTSDKHCPPISTGFEHQASMMQTQGPPPPRLTRCSG